MIHEKSTRKRKKTWSKETFTPSWWRRVDSNHRSETQQIYSLPPLATRELLRIQLVPNQIEAQRSGFDLERSRAVGSELSHIRESERSERRGDVELVDGFEPPTC